MLNAQGSILLASAIPKRRISAAATASVPLSLTVGTKAIVLIHLNVLFISELRGQKTNFSDSNLSVT